MPDQRRLEHVRTALRAAGRLDSLLADILAMADLDSTTLVVHPTPVSLANPARYAPREPTGSVLTLRLPHARSAEPDASAARP